LKGGEKVQVGGLGFINTITSSGKNPSTSEGFGFADHLGSIMGSGIISQKGDSINSSSVGSLNQEVSELLDFLKSDDIFDIKEGINLLKQINDTDNNDLLSAIKSYLGLEDEEFKEMVNSFQTLLSNDSNKNGKVIATSGKMTVELNTENLKENHLEKTLDEDSTLQGKELDELLACLNQIIALPIQDLPKMINKDFSEIIKVVKLYELLSKNQDGTIKNTPLSEMIHQIAQKLEIVVEQHKETTRNDYLQKTFHSVEKELQTLQSTENGQVNNQTTLKLDAAGGMAHFHQMTKPEQLMVMLDTGGKPISAEQLIQQFGNILSKSQFSKIGGTQKLFIKLNPENLGSIRIELIQKDSTIVARIMTTTGAAKDVLESQLQGLKHAFSSQNIPVDRIEITQQITNPQERFFHRDQQQGHQQNEEQTQKDQSNDGEFNQSFEEALLNIEV
jgi:flagellar hook-length control protein FliK